MKLTTGFVAICCAFVLFVACKKKKDEDSSTQSPTALLLLNAKWQQIAETGTVKYNGADTTVDYFAAMDECEKDDYVIFAENGKVSIDEAANKCPDDNQVETASWKLLNNDTKLAIYDSNPDTFDLEVSSTQMKFTYVKPNSSGQPITIVSTYKNIR